MICKSHDCVSRAGPSGYCPRCAQHALLALQTEAILEGNTAPEPPAIRPIRPPMCLVCPQRDHLTPDGLCRTCAVEYAAARNVHPLSVYEWLLWRSA